MAFTIYRCSRCKAIQMPSLPSGRYHPLFREFIGRAGLTMGSQELTDQTAVSVADISVMIEAEIRRRLDGRVIHAPLILGMDGSMLAGSMRTALVDTERKIHIDILPTDKEADIVAALVAYKEDWNGLMGIVIDQSYTLRRAAQAAFPGVPIILDRFHVAVLINHAFAAFVDRYRKEYIDANGKAKNLPPHSAALRMTEKSKVAAKIEQLKDDWPVLARAMKHARGWQDLYEVNSGAEARAQWIEWMNSIPVEIAPELRPIAHKITRNWLDELCNGVEVKTALGRVPTNGTTESLNNHFRKWDIRTNSTFYMGRGRVLLTRSKIQRDQEAKERRARLKGRHAQLSARLK
ncbi:ISL3 family transposase [Deinococcus aquaticus]|uniref:ISL3 family transposase n=1 Tax=Deinococcus aquaticus TaxID=328692 RepID=UPI003F45260F